MTVVGVLHPGEMGAGFAATLQDVGHDVLWASAGRSEDTARRAAAAGIRDAGSVAELVARSEIVLSICPPHGALGVADAVTGFTGVFVDANAISPRTAAEVCARIESGGATYVDGGITGPPPHEAGTTRLFLSGPAAPALPALFEGSRVEPVVVDGPLTAASALKMSYAAWTKGSWALVLAVRSLARSEGVEDVLVAEWERSRRDVADRLREAAFQAARKGWRWTAEMDQIAETMAAAGLPPGFHEAASEMYARIPRANDVGKDDETVSRVVDTLVGAGARDDG